MSGIYVSCQPAIATLLHHDSFLWVNASTPSGFAMSVLTYETTHRRCVLTEALAIDLSTRHEMTPSTIMKLTKTHIIFAQNSKELVEKLKAIHALSQLFWEQTSKLPQILIALLNWCTSNRLIIKTRAASDPQFYARLITCVNEVVDNVISDCSLKTQIIGQPL